MDRSIVEAAWRVPGTVPGSSPQQSSLASIRLVGNDLTRASPDRAPPAPSGRHVFSASPSTSARICAATHHRVGRLRVNHPDSPTRIDTVTPPTETTDPLNTATTATPRRPNLFNMTPPTSGMRHTVEQTRVPMSWAPVPTPPGTIDRPVQQDDCARSNNRQTTPRLKPRRCRSGAIAQLGRAALCAVVLGRGSRGVIAVEA